jgi:aminoglycoside phosphotransferase (APT) family kinase protein
VTVDLDTATAIAGFPVRRVEPLAGGRNRSVFEQRGEGAGVVLKLYPPPWEWKLGKEAFAYGLVAELELPPARLLATHDTRRLLREPHAVLTKLQGDRLLARLERLDADEQLDVAMQVGALLRRLHTICFEQFGYVGTHGLVDPHPTNAEYMSFQFEKKLREFVALGGDRRLAAEVRRVADTQSGLLAGCARAVLCHDDCHDENVLVDAELRVTGLVDFENAVAGDPLLDLAKAHCYSRRKVPGLLDALADGYGELRAGWREAVRIYELYHWLELSDWLAAAAIRGRLDELAGGMRRLCAEAA